MFSFNPAPMGFQYPGQAPVYHPPYGGYNPQVPAPFQHHPSRGQSLPATMRQCPPSNGHYPQRYDQYQPPPPSRHYEYRYKKHHKRPSISPIHTPDQDLYSDKEKANQKSSDDCSRSQSKQEGTPNHQSPGIENNEESQRDTNDNEDQQHDSKEIPKRKSRPRKKKHDRREHYNPQFYGELPPHNRAHQQPLYNGYNQPYDEPIRRQDVYHKPPPPQQFPNIQSGYNPYQSYPPHQGYAPPPPPSQQWSHLNGHRHPSEREIQRLRNRIQTLEDQLHKLQKKLKTVTLTNTETSGQDEPVLKNRRTKRDRIRSPRQTPVIVELNTTTNETLRESTPKKNRHRTASNISSNQTIQSEKNPPDQDTTPTPRNQQPIDPRSSGGGTGQQILETESKKPHEETATHIQQIPPPPPVQQNSFPPHGQPLNSANNHYPNDAYQQLQHIFLSTNYNQSNNNEILDNKEEKRTRTAERILDAFERFYINTGRSPLTPIKVKFIPDETNSNYNHNQNLIST